MRKRFFLPILMLFLCGAVAEIETSSKALSLLEAISYYKLNGQASLKMQGLVKNYPHRGLDFPINNEETLKRSGYHHTRENHCSCNATYLPKDLGVEFFPRYVTIAYCDAHVCANRTQTCQQKMYTIKVLRKRRQNQKEDSFLPEALRANWLFQDYPVAVTCECAA